MDKDAYLSKIWKTLILLLVLFALTYFYHFHRDWPNPNERSRLYLAIAIAERGQFNIDDEIERYGVIWDRAVYKGRIYSDKAPGISFVSSIPIFLCNTLYKGIFNKRPSIEIYYIVAVLFTSVLFTLLSILFLLRLFELYELSKKTSILTIISLILGTYSGTYSMLFFGHQFVSSLLFISFVLVELYIRQKRDSLYIVFASIFAGFAFISEYPTILISIGIFIYLIQSTKNKRVFIYALPGVLPLFLLIFYFYICFGSTFSTGYSHLDSETFAKIHSEGFMGFKYPSIIALLNLLFGSQRGLFFFSPVLVFSVLYLIRHSFKSALMKFHLILFVGYSLLISSFGYWIGGDVAGARHLLPLNYFLIIPLAFFIDGLKRGSVFLPIFYGLLVISVFNIVVSTVSWPFFPPQFLNPLAHFAMVLIKEGYITHSIVNLVGIYSFSSLGVYLLFIMVIIFTVMVFDIKKNIFSYVTIAEMLLIWILFVLILFPSKPDENNFKEIVRIQKAFDPKPYVDLPYQGYTGRENYICIKRGNMLMRNSNILEAIKEYRCR